MANILSYPGIGVVAVSPDSFKIPERLAIIVVPFIRSWFRIGHKIITPTSISTSPNVYRDNKESSRSSTQHQGMQASFLTNPADFSAASCR